MSIVFIRIIFMLLSCVLTVYYSISTFILMYENNFVYSRAFQIFATRCLFCWNAASERPTSQARGIPGGCLCLAQLCAKCHGGKSVIPASGDNETALLIQFLHIVRTFQLFNLNKRQLR